jgi:hypothetical protein
VAVACWGWGMAPEAARKAACWVCVVETFWTCVSAPLQAPRAAA